MVKNKGKTATKQTAKPPKPTNDEKAEQKRKSDETAREMIKRYLEHRDEGHLYPPTVNGIDGVLLSASLVMALVYMFPGLPSFQIALPFKILPIGILSSYVFTKRTRVRSLDGPISALSMALFLHCIGDVFQTVRQYSHLTTPLNSTNITYPDSVFYLYRDKDIININNSILEQDTLPILYYFVLALPFYILGWTLLVSLWLSELQLSMSQWLYVFTRNKKVVVFSACYILFIALVVKGSKTSLFQLLSTSELGWFNGKLLAYLVMMFLGICCALLVDEPLALGGTCLHFFAVLTIFLEYVLRWNMIGSDWFNGSLWAMFYVSEMLIAFGMLRFIQNVHPAQASKHQLSGDPLSDIWQFATPQERDEFTEFN